MDLNIVLWIGGVLFSLGIFAVKVGFGLGFGRMRWKGVFLTLSLYIVLFVLIATLSEQLIKTLEPILKKGPYLHALMATGMIVWGVLLLRKHKREASQPFNLSTSSLLLLIPCPVCLTAMAFSTWAALSVIKFPASLVGLGLGIVFVLLTLAVVGLTRFKQTSNPEISLGLGMIAIGLYFISSLFLPRKIEEAKAVYQSFIKEGMGIDAGNMAGVIIILILAGLVGYLTNLKKDI
jgi:predicted transporter